MARSQAPSQRTRRCRLPKGASNRRTAILASPPVALKPAQLDLNKPPELVNFPLWQGGRGMRIMTAAFALGTALVLCNLGTFSGVAQARTAKVVREPRVRLIVRVPVVTPWDYYIVPRYRYRPQDDRIDPYGPPVVPVIRVGPQEETLPGFAGTAFPPP